MLQHVMEARQGHPAAAPGMSATSREAEHAPVAAGRKRALDLLVGSTAMLVMLPLFAVVAIAIRLDSPGPAFFRQERVGRDGSRFRIWKFRSMHRDNEELVHRAAATAWFAATPVDGRYKSSADPRITRVGRFIRKTSIDELPQLINVIRGEMSLVGPRPAIPYELQLYQPSYFERQRVKPGMTGLWQVSGRTSVSAAEMMNLDIRYVREASISLDFKIILRTVPALIGRRHTGA